MQSKVMWFLILLVHTSLVAAGVSTAPPPPSPPGATSGPPSSATSSHPPTPSYAYKTAPPVFTADNARHTTHSPPPTSTHARTRQIHKQPKYKQPNYYDVDAGVNPDGPTIASVENNFNVEVPFIEHRSGRDEDVKDADNAGFVPPVDFSSILSDLDKVSGGKDARDILRNPFATEKRNRNRDGFPDFFNEAESKDSVFEPNFGSLASSASDQKTRKVKEEDEEGFVDPNVQFRSLFDSTETADGFRPNDFLDYQSEPADADLSKSSQSRAYPQFTYTGRDGDDSDGEDEEDEVYSELNNPRYRSSYRQVDSRKRDPYDDSNYYSGERDRSPAAPAPPPPKYKVGRGESGGGSGKGGKAASSTTEETAHSPQSGSGGGGSKGDSPGKNKCKKIEKLVEENEEYDSYLEPEEGYDPSTYNSRYKRQASGRRQTRDKGNKKRPMTCYVCEDEEGRYAERCSYDSKADPKQGSYFHSSSTSFNDNGNKKGGRGGRGSGGGGRGSGGDRGGDRYKRDPEHSAPAAATSTGLVAQASSFKDRESVESSTEDDEEELPKKLQKRQSNGGRYASGYPAQGPRPSRQDQSGNRRQEEYEDADDEDYESPYSPYGNDANRDEYGFAPSSQGRRNRGGRQNEFDIRIPTPDYAADPGINNGNRARDDDYDEGYDYGREPSSGRGGNRNRGGGGGGRARSNSPPDSIDFDLGPGPSYGGGPSGGNRRAGSGGSGGRRGAAPGGGGRGQQEFGFGAPQDFGRDQGEASRGFNVDFSIPKEFDPDVQLGASNSNNRPVFNNDFGPEFDNAYEEHVKQYFPEAFGGGSSTQGPERGHSPPGPSSTYRPSGGPGPYSSPSGPRPAPVYHHSNRGRSPTQQRHQYSPPPYFNGPQYYGPSSEDDDIAHSNGQLHQAVNSFQQKGVRPGCQKVQKGDMSCVVCSDPRGMKKEECMYASNDPKNHQMAYHEVSEYSSLPPASILPSPNSQSSSPKQPKFGDKNKPVESRTIVHQESRRVEVKKSPSKTKTEKSPLDYDFDY